MNTRDTIGKYDIGEEIGEGSFAPVYADQDMDTRNATGKYDIGEEIGEGSFASVFAGQNKTTGQKVALKFFKRQSGYVFPGSALRECAILTKLDHKNIVRNKSSQESHVIHPNEKIA